MAFAPRPTASSFADSIRPAVKSMAAVTLVMAMTVAAHDLWALMSAWFILLNATS